MQFVWLQSVMVVFDGSNIECIETLSEYDLWMDLEQYYEFQSLYVLRSHQQFYHIRLLNLTVV